MPHALPPGLAIASLGDQFLWDTSMPNIALVAGSGRTSSQSAKVARFLPPRLIQRKQTTDQLSGVIDLWWAPLPLWPGEDAGPWNLYSQQLKNANAVVIVAPEGNGMACPAFANGM